MITALVNRLTLLCLLQMFLSATARGQEPAMRHYTVNDGLASSTVYTILCDSKGFIWFCTEAGVSRYDGHEFKNYTTSDGLSDNEMLRAYEDTRGRIWFMGFNGTLSYYYQRKFFNPSDDTVLKKAKKKCAYRKLFEDKLQRLWFTTDNDYVVIDGNTVTDIDPSVSNSGHQGIFINSSSGGVYLLSQLSPTHASLRLLTEKSSRPINTRYWPAYKNGFYRFSDGSILFRAEAGLVKQKDTTQELLRPLGKEFEGIDIDAIFVDIRNRLWVGTHGRGVFCFDFKDPGKPPARYLNRVAVFDIREDLEGNIWMSTGGQGVYMLPRGGGAVHNYDLNKGLENNGVFSVTKDGSGNIYAGMDKGNVVAISKGIISPLLSRENASGYNRVSKIIARGKYLWIGSNSDLICMDKTNGTCCKMKSVHPIDKTVRFAAGVKDMSLFKDHLSVCVSHWMFRNEDTGRSKCNWLLKAISPDGNRCYSTCIDREGTVWYGMHGGLYSSRGAKSIRHPTPGLGEEVRISGIAETADSTLAVATYGSGIFFFRNDKITARLTKQDGLSSDICKRVFVYRDEVYVATNNGAIRIAYNKGNAQVEKKYSTADGLLSNDVNDVFVDDSDICLATSGGLSIVERHAPEYNAAAPPVYIYVISNNGRQLSVDSSYEFHYWQDALHVDFIGISYRRAKDVRYQYRVNDERPWQETDNSSIDFPFLQAGNYHFQLRARIADSPWSDTKSFYFVINPPFWKTLWFASICGLLFIVLVLGIAVSRVKSIKRRQDEKIKIRDQVTQLEQQALQAMMNPHFIFNVMNSIQHYINNNEKHEANMYLSNFATLIRMNLDIASKRYIPLDDEIAYLELYLSLERIRFGRRLTYKMQVDSTIDTDETMIPVMLLQPFIENAIWHGILPKKEDGHVQVDIKKDRGMLRITITDDGVGIPDAKEGAAENVKKHVSRGMQMTQHRLDLIGRMTHQSLSIQITDAYPGAQYKGTKVEFSIPGDLM